MKSITLFILILLISGCSMLRDQTKLEWPAGLPPIDHYLNYYNQDSANKELISQDEYLLWVKRLYLGWELYRNGWLKLSSNLVETLEDQDEKNIAREKLAFMGKIVSSEWAKHRRLSIVKTRNLIIWGKALDQSPENGEQLEIIDKILDDVSLLLTRELLPSNILSDRYYPQESLGGADDPFR